jgi:hypothetical protein
VVDDPRVLLRFGTLQPSVLRKKRLLVVVQNAVDLGQEVVTVAFGLGLMLVDSQSPREDVAVVQSTWVDVHDASWELRLIVNEAILTSWKDSPMLPS